MRSMETNLDICGTKVGVTVDWDAEFDINDRLNIHIRKVKVIGERKPLTLPNAVIKALGAEVIKFIVNNDPWIDDQPYPEAAK